MDLNVIKARLQALNQENTNTGSDTAKYFWKPELGKSVVRIVPSMYDKENPFTELRFHQNKGVFKYPILALSNFEQKDPIEEFILKLRELGGKDNWSLSGKLEPRARYFVPVIVRGEEDKGVRLWSIGVTMFKSLLQLAAEEEVGDYTDVVNGRDITVTKVNGDPYPEISIMPKMSISALSADAKQVEKWLTDQPRPVDCFKHYDYAYIKKALETFLTGGKQTAETPQIVASNPIVEAGEKIATEHKAEAEKPKEEFKVAATPKSATKAAPKSAAAKFEDLFGEEETSGEGEEDDLGF